MTLTFVYLLTGLVLLSCGAEALVRGAAKLAKRLGISSRVIGLTVVALGTSTPDLAVSVQAAHSGSGDIAVGNVIGSNIANILLILGLSALLAPLTVSPKLLRRGVPMMIASGLLTFILARDGHISHLDSCVLLAGMLCYTLFLVFAGQGERHPAQDVQASPERNKGRATVSGLFSQSLLILLGLGLLLLGSQLLVEGATSLARSLGLSELVIGLTLVALSTSLPELATSLLAIYHGERGMAVGNAVGSCIINLLLVLGVSALITPDGLSISPNALTFDLPVMLAVSIACLPVFFSGYRINRWEGVLFLGYYLAYILYLALFSTGLQTIELLRQVMICYAIPLTSVTLLAVLLRTRQRTL